MLRKFMTNPMKEIQNTFQNHKAKTCQTFKESKRKTYRNYI